MQAETNAIPMSAEDLQELQELRARKAQYQQALRDKELASRKRKAGADFYARRQTLVLRRVRQEEIAPDDHVLAYIDVVKMRKVVDPSTKNPQVSDSDITAFCALEQDGKLASEITLDLIEMKKRDMENPQA